MRMADIFRGNQRDFIDVQKNSLYEIIAILECSTVFP